MRDEIAKVKATYLAGMRVRLVKMDDIQAPPIGTEGTVRGVDDIGSVIVAWDNDSGLNVVLGEDEIEVVKNETMVDELYEKRKERLVNCGFILGKEEFEDIILSD